MRWWRQRLPPQARWHWRMADGDTTTADMAATRPASSCSSRPTACARTRSRVRRRRRRPGLPRPAARWRARVRPRPADPGAAEHRRRLVHADHRRVARRPRLDQQHVPHQRRRRSGAPPRFGTSGCVPDGTSVLQAETLAQSAERGGKKVAQIEWAGGRSGSIQGPTLDFRRFLSGRGVATNYISPTDLPNFVASFGLQFDHPDGFATARRSRRRRPSPRPAGPACPQSYSPAKEMRLRVLDGSPPAPTSTASTPTSTTAGRPQDALRPRPVLAAPRTAPTRSATSRRASGPTSRSRSNGGALNGKTGAFLVKVERLDADLSHVRLFHTSVTRAIAIWPSWPGEPGFTGTFEDFVAEQLPVLAGRRLRRARVRHRQRGHLHRAGRVLGDALPPADQVRARHVQAGPRARRLPRHGRGPAPVPRARHQEAAQRRDEPGLRRRRGQRHAGPPRQAARGSTSARPTRAPDATMRLAQEHMHDSAA